MAAGASESGAVAAARAPASPIAVSKSAKLRAGRIGGNHPRAASGDGRDGGIGGAQQATKKKKTTMQGAVGGASGGGDGDG